MALCDEASLLTQKQIFQNKAESVSWREHELNVAWHQAEERTWTGDTSPPADTPAHPSGAQAIGAGRRGGAEQEVRAALKDDGAH